MVGNSISEKMMPLKAQLLAVAGFYCPRKDVFENFVYKSLKNNNLPPPPSKFVSSIKL